MILEMVLCVVMTAAIKEKNEHPVTLKINTVRGENIKGRN